MTARPKLAGLPSAGWSVGKSCRATDTRPVWQADGRDGENVILNRGVTGFVRSNRWTINRGVAPFRPASPISLRIVCRTSSLTALG